MFHATGQPTVVRRSHNLYRPTYPPSICRLVDVHICHCFRFFEAFLKIILQDTVLGFVFNIFFWIIIQDFLNSPEVLPENLKVLSCISPDPAPAIFFLIFPVLFSGGINWTISSKAYLGKFWNDLLRNLGKLLKLSIEKKYWSSFWRSSKRKSWRKSIDELRQSR